MIEIVNISSEHEQINEVLKKCKMVYNILHNPFFENKFFPEKKDLFTKIFTSLDVIEDTQNAIIEFKNIPENSITNRTTLYIYGVLQSMYCQQDGAMHLYKSIVEPDAKTKSDYIYELFEKYNIDKKIRIIRDDIAGHPADRNRGKEFYFIAKGSNTKFEFTYCGYTPDFKTVDVNLSELLEIQENFTCNILNNIANVIKNKIIEHKKNYMQEKLFDYNDAFDAYQRLIIKGIYDRHFGIDTIPFLNKLKKLEDNLKERYFDNIPDVLKIILPKMEYILKKLSDWENSNKIENNLEVHIFMDSFDCYLKELKSILIEIDNEFELNE